MYVVELEEIFGRLLSLKSDKLLYKFELWEYVGALVHIERRIPRCRLLRHGIDRGCGWGSWGINHCCPLIK